MNKKFFSHFIETMTFRIQQPEHRQAEKSSWESHVSQDFEILRKGPYYVRWGLSERDRLDQKKSKQALIGVLVKYHHKHTEWLTNKLHKLKQYKSRRNTVTKQMSHQKTQSPARRKTVNKDDNVNELAEDQD